MAVSEVPSAFLLIKFRKRISLDKIMLCCAVFMTFKNMFAAFSDNVWVIVISQGCEMLGFGLFYSGSVYLIEEMLSPADVWMDKFQIRTYSAHGFQRSDKCSVHCMYSDHVSCVKRDSRQNNKKQLIYDERKVW